MGKVEIIPTVFAKSIGEQEARLTKLSKVSKRLQIDIMDGKFVNATSPHPVSLPTLRQFKGVKFEAHLMTLEPETYISLLKEKGCDKIIFHYEALKNAGGIRNLIGMIKKEKMKAFIAINPETNVKDIFPFVKNIGGVMFMGVHPGQEGQDFIDGTLDKIKEFRVENKRIAIEVDGGVNYDNIKSIAKVGATLFGVGSLVGKAQNPKAVIKELERAAKKR